MSTREPQETAGRRESDSTEELPVFPARRVLGSALAIGLILAGVLAANHWLRPLERPDLSDLRDKPSQEIAVDPEQSAFLEPRDEAPLPPLESAPSSIDYPWIARLKGEWSFDLSRGVVALSFSDDPPRPALESLGPLDHFPVRGLDPDDESPTYFTVLTSQDSNNPFLLLRDAQGKTLDMLDDLKVHGTDLISYRLRGSSSRRYGHRLRGPQNVPFRMAQIEHESGEAEERETDRHTQASRIQVHRLSSSELWQKAEAFKRAGRFDSLERLLRRIPPSDPKARRARQWQKRLPRWRKDQKSRMNRDLRRSLETLQRGIEAGRSEAVLPLFTDGAQRPTQEFLDGFFARGDRHGARYLLKSLELQDGVLIFDVTYTLESVSGSTLSLETHPWRARLHGKQILDPFPS